MGIHLKDTLRRDTLRSQAQERTLHHPGRTRPHLGRILRLLGHTRRRDTLGTHRKEEGIHHREATHLQVTPAHLLHTRVMEVMEVMEETWELCWLEARRLRRLPMVHTSWVLITGMEEDTAGLEDMEATVVSAMVTATTATTASSSTGSMASSSTGSTACSVASSRSGSDVHGYFQFHVKASKTIVENAYACVLLYLSYVVAPWELPFFIIWYSSTLACFE